MNWYITINALLPLACEANDLADAQQVFAQSEFMIPVGQPNKTGAPTFGVVPVPGELSDWLSYKSPSHAIDRCPGGWLCAHSAHVESPLVFVPVWGASGLRTVERTYITLPKGTIPSQQGWPNG